MKSLLILISAFSIQAAVAVASTSPSAVPGIDAAREGDLAQKAAEYYGKNGKPKGCETEGYGLTTYSALKIASGSLALDKKAGANVSYEASYLALSICNTGSTYRGAYRSVMDAALIKAVRVGPVDDNGTIQPNQADQFTIVRKIDTKQFNVGSSLFE